MKTVTTVNDLYLVYVIQCNNKNYVGMTHNFFRRWRQHNGEIQGGAKYTTRHRKDMWYPILIIDGFKTMQEAMQCEWKLKRKHGITKRIQWANELLTNHTHWTSKSPPIASQKLTVYVDSQYSHLLTIDTHELYWKW